MNLDEIIMRAIPITPADCSIKKAQKERLRRETKARIEEYVREEIVKAQLKEAQNSY